MELLASWPSLTLSPETVVGNVATRWLSSAIFFSRRYVPGLRPAARPFVQ